MPVTFLISYSVWLCVRINYRSGKENFQHGAKKEVKVGQEGEATSKAFPLCFRQPRTQTVPVSLVCSQLQAVVPCTAVVTQGCGNIHGGLSLGIGFVVLFLVVEHCWEWASRRWVLGRLVGGPGFTWMSTGCQSIFPRGKSSASLLCYLAQGCSTWYCWARPFNSSCFHHRPWLWWLFHHHCF